jgi:hypothetical protein
MTRPTVPDGSRRRVGVGVDARRLWSAGVASAVVAGLVALVGVLVSRWLFHLAVLAPRRDGAYGDVHTTGLVLAAAAAALAATGLVHLLMLSTPRPLMFFGWIVALLITLVVVFPFSTTAPLDAKIATAVVDLAIGVVTGTLVGGAAARSTTRSRPPPSDIPPPYDDRPRYGQPPPYDQPQPYDRRQPYGQPRPYDQTRPYERPPYGQPRDPGRPGTGYP